MQLLQILCTFSLHLCKDIRLWLLIKRSSYNSFTEPVYWWTLVHIIIIIIIIIIINLIFYIVQFDTNGILTALYMLHSHNVHVCMHAYMYTCMKIHSWKLKQSYNPCIHVCLQTHCHMYKSTNILTRWPILTWLTPVKSIPLTVTPFKVSYFTNCYQFSHFSHTDLLY